MFNILSKSFHKLNSSVFGFLAWNTTAGDSDVEEAILSCEDERGEFKSSSFCCCLINPSNPSSSDTSIKPLFRFRSDLSSVNCDKSVLLNEFITFGLGENNWSE